VSELQELVTSWLTELAAVLPFGFAFGVGMVAAVNPCGFAMLPAYLSLYLGAHEEDFGKRLPTTRLLQALLVGVAVSLGFILLFGLAGLVISAGGSALLGVMPSLGIVIGGVLVLVGLWMLAGRALHANAFERFAGRLGDPRNVSVPGFFLFGLAYGAASLSCALPAFLAVVGSSLASGGVLAGAGRFFGFALGMAAVLLTLTLAFAFFKQGLIKRLRKAVPYVQLASAVLLVLAGAYVTFYWLSSGSAGVLS
jgi:cytochrome c-type biogenesis protein